MNKDVRKGLSWNLIKQYYPHKYVALTNIEYGCNKASIIKADVLYTNDEKTYEELLLMYLNGEILLRYTTLDEDEAEGVI